MKDSGFVLSCLFLSHSMKAGHAASDCSKEFKKQVYPKFLIPITSPKNINEQL